MARRRRRRNPTVLDVLPWLLGGAAVIGTAAVIYNASSNGLPAQIAAAKAKATPPKSILGV